MIGCHACINWLSMINCKRRDDVYQGSNSCQLPCDSDIIVRYCSVGPGYVVGRSESKCQVRYTSSTTNAGHKGKESFLSLFDRVKRTWADNEAYQTRLQITPSYESRAYAIIPLARILYSYQMTLYQSILSATLLDSTFPVRM